VARSRAISSTILQPGTRVFPVAEFRRERLRWDHGKGFKIRHRMRPGQMLMVPLVRVGFQAAITSGLAFRVDQVFDGSARHQVEFVDATIEKSAASDGRVDAGQGAEPPRAIVPAFFPGGLKLELDLGPVQHVQLSEPCPKGIAQGVAPALVSTVLKIPRNRVIESRRKNRPKSILPWLRRRDPSC
jgi:hypothetical protein